MATSHLLPELHFFNLTSADAPVDYPVRPLDSFKSSTRTALSFCTAIDDFSSTVFTANSGGSAGAALFNATLSNLIGVVITPIWCLALLAKANNEFPPAGSLIAKIVFFILLPLVIGQLIRIATTD